MRLEGRKIRERIVNALDLHRGKKARKSGPGAPASLGSTFHIDLRSGGTPAIHHFFCPTISIRWDGRTRSSYGDDLSISRCCSSSPMFSPPANNFRDHLKTATRAAGPSCCKARAEIPSRKIRAAPRLGSKSALAVAKTSSMASLRPATTEYGGAGTCDRQHERRSRPNGHCSLRRKANKAAVNVGGPAGKFCPTTTGCCGISISTRQQSAANMCNQ